MQKIQAFLREDQKAALKKIAARTGQKQSDLIRQGVDLVIDRADSEKADWRKATDAVFGIWKDRTDLDEIAREFREADKRRLPSVYRGR